MKSLLDAAVLPLVAHRRLDRRHPAAPGLIESVHRGSVVVLDGHGEVFRHGDAELGCFLRSAAKPLQLLPLVRRGLDRRHELEPADLAVMMASHSGEPQHLRRVRSLLSRFQLNEDLLRCGAHLPMHAPSAAPLLASGQAPSPIHNNCSGKHTNMLAVCRAEGWSLDDYPEPAHPLQQEIRTALHTISGVEDAIEGRDGCSVVTFGMRLLDLARLYQRLAAGTHPWPEELERILRAGAAHPEMVGGTGRLDTAVMRAAGGALFSKVGAEGVSTVAVFPSARFPTGLGIALKIEDGDGRGSVRAFYLCHLLAGLGLIALDHPAVAPLVRREIDNARGIRVGRRTVEGRLPG